MISQQCRKRQACCACPSSGSTASSAPARSKASRTGGTCAPRNSGIEYVQRYGFILQESFRKQRKAAVTVFCQEPKSHKQIQKFLDLADKRFFMESVLQPLVEEGTLMIKKHDQSAYAYQNYVASRRLSEQEIQEQSEEE